MGRITKPPKLRKWKPGQICPISGQYAVWHQARRYGKFKPASEITMVEGEVFPPHGEGKVRYRLADTTRHESKP